jgi:HSP20 family protein
MQTAPQTPKTTLAKPPAAPPTQPTRHTPRQFVEEFRSDLEHLWERATAGDYWPFDRMSLSKDTDWMPSLDAYRSDGKLTIEVDLPGMTKDDVKVRVEDGSLVIEGERRAETKLEEGDIYRYERSYGSFYRRLPLPAEASGEDVEAHFDNGVLCVTMPAPAEHKGQAKEVAIT